MASRPGTAGSSEPALTLDDLPENSLAPPPITRSESPPKVPAGARQRVSTATLGLMKKSKNSHIIAHNVVVALTGALPRVKNAWRKPLNLLKALLPTIKADKFDKPPPTKPQQALGSLASAFGPIMPKSPTKQRKSSERQDEESKIVRFSDSMLVDVGDYQPPRDTRTPSSVVSSKLGHSYKQLLAAEAKAEEEMKNQQQLRIKLGKLIANLSNLASYFRTTEAELEAEKGKYEVLEEQPIQGLQEAEAAWDEARRIAKEALEALQAMEAVHADKPGQKAAEHRIYREDMRASQEVVRQMDATEDETNEAIARRRVAASALVNTTRFREGDAHRHWKALQKAKKDLVYASHEKIYAKKNTLRAIKDAHNKTHREIQELLRDIAFQEGLVNKWLAKVEELLRQVLRVRILDIRSGVSEEEMEAEEAERTAALHLLAAQGDRLEELIDYNQARVDAHDTSLTALRSQAEVEEQVQLVGAEADLEVAHWKSVIAQRLLQGYKERRDLLEAERERLAREAGVAPEAPGDEVLVEKLIKKAKEKMKPAYVEKWDGVFDTAFLDSTIFAGRRHPGSKPGSTEGYFDTDTAKSLRMNQDWMRTVDHKFEDYLKSTDRKLKRGEVSMEEELVVIEKALHKQYMHIINCYSYFCTTGSEVGESCWSMKYGRFVEFLKTFKISKASSKFCKARDCDIMFTEVNKESDEAGERLGNTSGAAVRDIEAENEVNLDRALMRFEFLEMFIRLSVAKYGRGQKAANIGDAITRLGEKIECYITLEARLDPNVFRAKRLYTLEMHELLTRYKAFLQAMYDWAKGRSSTHMNMEKWVDLLLAAGIIGNATGISRREAKLIFVWSQMPVENETKNRTRYMSMTFVDFLEAVARTGELLAAPTPPELDLFFSSTPKEGDNALGRGWSGRGMSSAKRSRLWEYFKEVEDSYANKHRRHSAQIMSNPTRPLVEKVSALLEVMLHEFMNKYSTTQYDRVCQQLSPLVRRSIIG